MEGQMAGWWTERLRDVCMKGSIDRWMDGYLDGWVDDWMDGRTAALLIPNEMIIFCCTAVV